MPLKKINLNTYKNKFKHLNKLIKIQWTTSVDKYTESDPILFFIEIADHLEKYFAFFLKVRHWEDDEKTETTLIFVCQSKEPGCDELSLAKRLEAKGEQPAWLFPNIQNKNISNSKSHYN